MVMEASPSPQCVGREFVRQYYTLLNKAPTHLHRFYNNYSSFVHGGLETNRESNPAIGQKQIHQKIQALNFQDCHAKINQVDSQSTLGNGVVVQVSGELSNAGHPMRRFTQTFVLAAQAPTKYYVHNDIFRYQDFGYADEEEEELEGEGNNENTERESEIENVRSEVEKEEQNQAQQLGAKISSVEQHNQNQQQPPSLSQQQIYYAIPQSQIRPVIHQVTINGSVHEDSSIISQQPLQQPQQQPQQYISEQTTQDQFQSEGEQDSISQQQQQQQPIKIEPHPTSEEVNEQPEAEQNYSSSVPEGDSEQQLTSQNTNSSGQKTYATSVKSNPNVGATSPQIPKPSISPPPIQSMRIDDRVLTHQPTTGTPLPSATGASMNQHVHRMAGVQQQTQQQYQQRLPRTGGPIQRGTFQIVDGERRTGRPGGYTDAHQLFLGNLPHSASENDLRQVFERFGRVAELRVHSRQHDRTKPQGTNNTRVPNYGFITFEDQNVVRKVLDSLPIFFPDEHGQKLNVEEKKIRPREGGGPGRPNPGDGNMRPMGTQQQTQQRGPGGPGGIMRGGQHGTRGRGGFGRGGGEGGRGGIRQPGGNPNNQNYQNRR